MCPGWTGKVLERVKGIELINEVIDYHTISPDYLIVSIARAIIIKMKIGSVL